MREMINKARLEINMKISGPSLLIILCLRFKVHSGFRNSTSKLAPHETAKWNTGQHLQQPWWRFSNLSSTDLQVPDPIWPFYQSAIVFPLHGTAKRPRMASVHGTTQNLDAWRLMIVRRLPLVCSVRRWFTPAGSRKDQQPRAWVGEKHGRRHRWELQTEIGDTSRPSRPNQDGMQLSAPEEALWSNVTIDIKANIKGYRIKMPTTTNKDCSPPQQLRGLQMVLFALLQIPTKLRRRRETHVWPSSCGVFK